MKNKEKIIFTDFNGVLQHNQYIPPYGDDIIHNFVLDEDGRVIGIAAPNTHKPFKEVPELDPKCVANLAKIAEFTGAKIVVSSHQAPIDMKDSDTVIRMLKGSGLDPKLIYQDWACGEVYDKRIAINLWLHKHKGQISNYIVIDDNKIADHPLVYISKGEIYNGLVDRYVKTAVDLMSSPASIPKVKLDIEIPANEVIVEDYNMSKFADFTDISREEWYSKNRHYL